MIDTSAFFFFDIDTILLHYAWYTLIADGCHYTHITTQLIFDDATWLLAIAFITPHCHWLRFHFRHKLSYYLPLLAGHYTLMPLAVVIGCHDILPLDTQPRHCHYAAFAIAFIGYIIDIFIGCNSRQPSLPLIRYYYCSLMPIRCHIDSCHIVIAITTLFSLIAAFACQYAIASFFRQLFGHCHTPPYWYWFSFFPPYTCYTYLSLAHYYWLQFSSLLHMIH